ncbi:MAG: hypothetical protein NTX79_07685 [Candidatus Micrarchaeota archaeon]|nr:hypothetical protein [Candidatus Micrarchaeota archaeon]
MYSEIPYACMRAYALLFTRFGASRPFAQSELDFVLSGPMKKKVFSILLNAGWIAKRGRREYRCNEPGEVFRHLLDFKVPQMLGKAQKPYAFSGLSAIEVWSDYSYTQRSQERSPYFIRVLRRDLPYWKVFFAAKRVPAYVGKGTSIGEFAILLPVAKLESVEKDGLSVEPLEDAMEEARGNEMHYYAYEYMKRKYREGYG